MQKSLVGEGNLSLPRAHEEALNEEPFVRCRLGIKPKRLLGDGEGVYDVGKVVFSLGEVQP